MEKSSKRGKIPQQDWPSIIARYEAGETLASIARTYDCSPPAISYIVSRTKARNAAAETTADPAPVAAEPQLLKGASEASTNNIAAGDLLHGGARGERSRLIGRPCCGATPDRAAGQPAATARTWLFADDPPQRPNPPGNPASRRVRCEPGVLRRRRWPILRYGHARRDETSPAGNGSAPRAIGSLPEARRRMAIRVEPSTCHCLTGMAARTVLIRCRIIRRTSPVPAPETAFLRAQPAPQPALANPRGRDRPAIIHRQSPGVPARENAAPYRPPGECTRRTESASRGAAREGRWRVYRSTLRERVDGDIAAFLAAFDAALDHDTSEVPH